MWILANLILLHCILLCFTSLDSLVSFVSLKQWLIHNFRSETWLMITNSWLSKFSWPIEVYLGLGSRSQVFHILVLNFKTWVYNETYLCQIWLHPVIIFFIWELELDACKIDHIFRFFVTEEGMQSYFHLLFWWNVTLRYWRIVLISVKKVNFPLIDIKPLYLITAAI